VQSNVTPPIIVDLGQVSLGEEDRHFASGGAVADDVQEVLRLVSARINVDNGRRTLVPIVVTYSKRERKPGRVVRVSRLRDGV
jgi:hypothetical protein